MPDNDHVADLTEQVFRCKRLAGLTTDNYARTALLELAEECANRAAELLRDRHFSQHRSGE